MPQTIAAAVEVAKIFVFNTLISLGVSGGVAWTAAGALTTAGVGYGLSRAAGLLTPAPPKPSDGKLTSRQGAPPRLSGFGRARLGGAYMLFAELDGISYDVLALHDGEVDAWERFYLHDDEVTVTSNNVQAGPDNRYKSDKLSIYTTLGADPGAAFSAITAALPAFWTSDHRGDGIAAAALICRAVESEDFSTVYPASSLPQLSVQGRLQRLYDPREAAHVQGTRATYDWSDNPILALLAFHTDAAGGMAEDFTARILPEIESWIAAADVCDELIPLDAGGAEKRYRCGGAYRHDNDPDAVVQKLLDACDGWIGETGSGAVRVYAGKYSEPSVAIGAEHIRGFSVQAFTPDEQAVNEIRFQYLSPDHQYTEVEGDPWTDEADVSARGRVRSAPVDLTWVPSHTQARRLVKRQMSRLAAPRRGLVETDLAGWNALGQRYIRLTIPALPSLASGAVVEVRKITLDIAGMGATIEWILADPDIDAWDETTEEGTPPPVPDPVISNAEPNVAPGAPTSVASAGGSGAALTTWRNPTSSNFDHAKVFRAATGAGFGAASAVSGDLVYAPGAEGAYNNTGIAAGTYDFWVVAYSPGGAASTPGGPATATVA